MMRLLKTLQLRAFVVLFAVYEISADCVVPDNESILQPGHEYHYRFYSEAFAEAVGTTNDRSKMTLNCEVQIRHAHECFYNMKMSRCTLTASGGVPESEIAWVDHLELTELSRNAIMFSLEDGKVKDVYAELDDPVYYLNIKRGALSAFVFKLSSTSREINEMHTDIHGTCPLVSVPTNDGGVRTSKDMLHCSFPSRPDWQLSPWSMFWNMSFIQHLINSTTDCDYRVDMTEKRLDKVHCKERHAIMLESTHHTTTAVQTNVYYSMVHLKSEKIEGNMEHRLPFRKTDIRFEYDSAPDPELSSNTFMSIAEEMLSDLVETSEDGIRLFTIPKFTEFVGWLRTSDNVLQLVESVKSCSFLRKDTTCTDTIKDLAMSYLNDGLVQCNTVPCVKAVSHLAVNGNLSSSYLNFVLYSWGNMHFTKPEMISHIKAICDANDSRFCWLTLGTIVKTFYRKNMVSFVELPKELVEVADHFYNSIGISCDGDGPDMNTFEEDEKKYNHLLTYLKAIGNMGEAYLSIAPGGSRQILHCVLKEKFPTFIKTTALESLYKLEACRNPQACSNLYRKLVPVLHNSTIDVELRVGVYHQFMLTPEEWNFEKDIIKLLLEGNNSQIRSYIASHLGNIIVDSDYRNDHSKFIQSLIQLLKENEITLEDLQISNEDISRSSSYGGFANFSFMPNGMQGFGVKMDESTIFTYYNMLPHVLRTNFTLQLFSKVINLFQTGSHFKDYESFGILIQKILLEVNPQPLSVERVFGILDELDIALKRGNRYTSGTKYLSDDIINNIQRIISVYYKYKPDGKPFFNLYLDMFGSTLSFLTSVDLLSLPSKLEYFLDLAERLREGVHYNNTRVVRVIEAYHQVPTMMGLPLNWTTNATLAFSTRQGLKLIYDQDDENNIELHGNGFFSPSIALTFLNRMVVDFPSITQIGVQANSSAYSSTQWRVEFDYSDAENIRRLKIERPQKSQKILELFRTNQLIKHNNYTDIPDWDIERTSSQWCINDQTSSILGLQVCHERSYPKVTHLVKPWALMAGWCKWRLEINPHDSELKSYNLELLKSPDRGPQNEIKLKLSAPGSSLKREMIINISANFLHKEGALNLRVPDLPDFDLSVSRNKLLENNKVVGYRSIILLKLQKNAKYQLTYNHEDKSEARREETSDKNQSPKSKKLVTLVQERMLNFETPFNDYKWTRKMHIQDGNIKADVQIFHENRHPHWNWLSRILPPMFWQTEATAWLQLRTSWKGPTQKSKDTVTQQTISEVVSPHSSVQFITNSLKMPGREQLNVNLTRTETATGKLLAFANFTYDSWRSGSDDVNEKEIRLFNFTIPRNSWGLQMQKIKEENKMMYDITIAQAKMIEKGNAANDYVGWWSEDQSHRFSLQHQEIKLNADVESRLLDGEQVSNELPNLQQDDVKDLKNEYTIANVGLHYPFNDREEVIKFNGKFVQSYAPSVFRYQKDFVLSSSYHNLQLDSHSTYRTDGEVQRSLSHSSYFTRINSGNKAFYNLDFRQSLRENRCIEVDVNHNISSSVFDLSTNVSYHCNHAGTQTHTLLLDSRTYSSYWNMLNTEISQIVEDVSPEFTQEYMNFTHPSLIINVTADWTGQEHRKKAVFKTLPDGLPLLEINLATPHSGEAELKLDIHNEEATKLVYKRKTTGDFKEFKVNLYSPNADSDVVNLDSKLLDSDQRLWKIEIYPVFSEVMHLIQKALKSTAAIGNAIANDPKHPLNEMLKPMLKMSAGQYWTTLKQEVTVNAYQVLNSVKEAFETLEPFYQPTLSVFKNALQEGKAVAEHIYFKIKDSSIAVWAINYFELPGLFQQGWMNIPHSISALKNAVLPGDRVLKFKFQTRRHLSWNSFKEFLSLSFDNLKSYITGNIINLHQGTQHHHRPAAGSKVAMIFGPRHVYTFDGRLYEFPNYPSPDCPFLLAHDVRNSMFSAIATSDLIHISFPEMMVSINSRNEVYINGSQSQHSLPVQSYNEKAVVRRDGDIITVWSPSLTVLCDGKNQLCSFEINAFNGAGTIGILGNADGETFNEFSLPDGGITADVGEFASSYELSGHKDCRNLKVPIQPQTSSALKERCLNQMRTLCAFSRSLQKPFSETCASDLHEGVDMCYSLAALSALCYYKEQEVSSYCNVKQQESKHIRHQLEVVLLVHEKASMFNKSGSTSYKGLESILDSIEEQFDSNGYSSILYSLVGFGGHGVYYHPSVHTLDSNIWVPHKKMVKNLLKTLDFKGTENIDPVTAVRYATEVMGHDTFNSKVFILITDEDQQTSDKETLQLVQNSLNKNGITLYTFTSYPSIEKGKKVFGVRADGLMFPSPKKGEAYLDYPRGDLAKLTSATRGSLFLHKFVDSNNPTTFFTEFAQEVWAKVRKEVQHCRDCKTVRSGWWYYHNECHIVNC